LIKVVPSSSRDGIAGWLGDARKIRVRAPAERGKANAAVEKIIAAALEISEDYAEVISGKTSVRKVVEIAGLSEAEVFHRLSK